MTLTTETIRNDYTGNGSTVTYPYTFKVFASSQLEVILTDDNGVETVQTNPTQYSVTGVGSDSGGNVVFVTAPPAPSDVTRKNIAIKATIPFTQTTDLVNETSFFQDRIETALDRIARQTQILNEVDSRSLRLPEGEAGTEILTVLPALQDRKGKSLSFDPVTGQLATVATATSAISTAMQPVVQSATTALARAAMGPWGDALVTATGGTIARTMAEVVRVVPISPFGYGAIGDGVADDTDAVADAISALCDTGGTLDLAGGKFKLTSQVVIASRYRVNIVGDFMGNAAKSYQGGFVLGADIAGSMIRYESPTANRAEGGGGTVRGVIFQCARDYSCTAALDLYDFSLSECVGCVFDGIKGRAIRGEYLVMSAIRDCVIRYCGDTGKPMVDLPSTDATYKIQSFEFKGNRIEVGYLSTYVVIGALATDVSVIDNRFEAAPSEVPDSAQVLLSIAGDSNRIIGNVFNRTSQTQFVLSGGYNTVVGNTFKGGAYATVAFSVTGSVNTIQGNTFASNRTGYEVELSGSGNIFNGNSLYYAGGIKAGERYGSVITGNHLGYLTCTASVLGSGNEYWINVRPTGVAQGGGEVVVGNHLENTGGPVTDVGGINLVTGNVCCVANTLRSFSGSGAGARGVRVATDDAIVENNIGSGAPIYLETGFNGAHIGVNKTSGATVPLSASATWDPGSISSGSSAGTTIAVTGAVLGDRVMSSFSLDLNGLALVAYVSAANTVTVRLLNLTGSPVDLASGTVRVRVEKP